MKKTFKLTEANQAEAIRLCMDGQTQAEVAANFGVSPTTISRLLSRSGVERNKGAYKLTQAQKADIVCRYLKGDNHKVICQDLGISSNALYYTLSKQGIFERVGKTERSKNSHALNEAFFDDIGTSEKASYWAGFIAADGCITGGMLKVGVSSVDREHLARFLRDTDAAHPIADRPEVINSAGVLRSRPISSISLGCAQWVDALAKVGIVPRKSLTLQWPSSGFTSDCIWHFIRGYFDGDGCWTFSKGRPQWSITGSADFVSGCVEFISREFHWSEPAVSLCGAHKLTGASRFTGFYKCSMVADMMYSGVTTYLPRKFEKVRPFLPSLFWPEEIS